MLVIGKASYENGNQSEAAEKVRRALVNSYLGISADEVISRDFRGRPNIAIPDTDISTSHSNGMVFVALCMPDKMAGAADRSLIPDFIQTSEHKGSFQQIGIDIEPLSRFSRQKCQRISEKLFFPEEKEALSAVSSEEHYQVTFGRMWTQKESYCKMTGDGISAIDSINTYCTPENIWRLTDIVDTEKGPFICSICAIMNDKE